LRIIPDLIEQIVLIGLDQAFLNEYPEEITVLIILTRASSDNFPHENFVALDIHLIPGNEAFIA
jgi:hypothetical protein